MRALATLAEYSSGCDVGDEDVGRVRATSLRRDAEPSAMAAVVGVVRR